MSNRSAKRKREEMIARMWRGGASETDQRRLASYIRTLEQRPDIQPAQKDQEFICTIEGVGEIKTMVPAKYANMEVAAIMNMVVKEAYEVLMGHKQETVFHPALGSRPRQET